MDLRKKISLSHLNVRFASLRGGKDSKRRKRDEYFWMNSVWERKKWKIFNQKPVRY